MRPDEMTRSERASGLNPATDPVILLDCPRCGRPVGFDSFAGAALPWLVCEGSQLWDDERDDFACSDETIPYPPAWLMREAGCAMLPTMDAVPLKGAPREMENDL